MSAWAVGDVVIVRDANEGRRGGPKVGTVVKVGRKLITVDAPHYWGEMQFRIDTGQRNDNYQHQSIQTPDEYADGVLAREIVTRLRAHGIELRGSRLGTDSLLGILAIVDPT